MSNTLILMSVSYCWLDDCNLATAAYEKIILKFIKFTIFISV